jgi:D-3-phosphoglycerate dehydrogenase
MENVDSLLLDLLEWLATKARPYEEVMDVWRTSCPRLPVWEEANDRGYVNQLYVMGTGRQVAISASGALHLQKSRSRDLTNF